ncbi:hypothetical protein, partial [uncultured Caballeronia sp.]|uniref:hypothetical protein n=1 Tax=uncultured Caballeronia sp. TaxID=1827198 RepID=UPI0035CA2FF8
PGLTVCAVARQENPGEPMGDWRFCMSCLKKTPARPFFFPKTKNLYHERLVQHCAGALSAAPEALDDSETKGHRQRVQRVNIIALYPAVIELLATTPRAAFLRGNIDDRCNGCHPSDCGY